MQHFRLSTSRLSSIIIIVALVIAGCDLTDDDDEDFAAVAGTWSADTFTLLADGETHDILEAGGDLRMTLNEDGTVDEGILTAPCTIPGVCADDEAEDFVAEFEGTFDIDGQSVTFSHTADTFIRDVVWLYDGTSLSTSTAVLAVVLTR